MAAIYDYNEYTGTDVTATTRAYDDEDSWITYECHGTRDKVKYVDCSPYESWVKMNKGFFGKKERRDKR